MRFSTVFTALAAALPLASAGAQAGTQRWRGFNIGANNEDGSCKNKDQWTDMFNRLKGLPQGINSVRLYASSDCNTLANAVPAALETGMKILVGVWVTDDGHFSREKDALYNIINQYGHDWIAAVSVGSEDLYRAQFQGTNEIDPDTLATRIYDVRGMVRSQGVNAPVGHVDTWNVWVDTNRNSVVIKACDFVGVDAYPYYQNVPIEGARDSFFSSLQQTRNAVSNVGSSAETWVTETGWPVSGPDFGPAVPSSTSAQTFWNQVACALFQEANVFWYSAQDYNSSPSFGVFDVNNAAIYAKDAC